MKKILKIFLIVLISFITIDTLQAIIFDNSPLIKIDNERGIFVNHYLCNNEKVTTWKWAKFACYEEVKEEKYSKIIDNIRIELSILKDWHYEQINSEDSKFTLKLYKDSKDKYATLNFYNNPFVVCATGRTSKEITLNNGIKAFIGYYDESIWSDISFYELNPNIAFINNNLLDDQNEFLEMVKTLNIGNYKL